ncbi:MAG: hypothetical protein Q4C47_05500, partial [Planctomycetia bacterium]|nr:hypothetical protein [Planctomycetia bacterium]
EVIRMLRETGFRIGIDSRCDEDVDQAIRCGVDFIFGVRTAERSRICHSGVLREFGLLSDEWDVAEPCTDDAERSPGVAPSVEGAETRERRAGSGGRVREEVGDEGEAIRERSRAVM